MSNVIRSSNLLVAVLFAVLLSSCFVLKQDETFAVGTEASRLNLVVFVSPTHGLNTIRVADGTSAARNVVLTQTPSTLSLSTTQLALACTFGGAALCVAAHLIPGVLLNWFKDDLRHRSDFGGDLSAADVQRDCFAWTAVPNRNFTTKSTGTSGCR